MQEPHFCHTGNLNSCTCGTIGSLCWGIMLSMMLCVISGLGWSCEWFDFYGLLNVRVYALCASQYRNAKTNRDEGQRATRRWHLALNLNTGYQIVVAVMCWNFVRLWWVRVQKMVLQKSAVRKFDKCNFRMTLTSHQILFGWSNQDEYDGWGM
jgi:hypothetical protein